MTTMSELDELKLERDDLQDRLQEVTLQSEDRGQAVAALINFAGKKADAVSELLAAILKLYQLLEASPDVDSGRTSDVLREIVEAMIFKCGHEVSDDDDA